MLIPLLLYPLISFIVDGGICEPLKVSSVKDDLSGTAKNIQGSYKYMGILKKDDSPVYGLQGALVDGYLVKEWLSSNRGFNGWKIVVIIKYISLRVHN